MIKYNGTTNLITSQDITLAGTSASLGSTLDEVLVAQQEAIELLKSNTKWLYKYGGTGSGTGSGTSTSAWSFTCTIGDKNITSSDILNPTIITLDGANTYNCICSCIKGGKGNEFNIKITLGESDYLLTASVDNSWEITQKLSLTNTTAYTLKILISDGDSSITYYARCFIEAFTPGDFCLYGKKELDYIKLTGTAFFNNDVEDYGSYYLGFSYTINTDINVLCKLETDTEYITLDKDNTILYFPITLNESYIGQYKYALQYKEGTEENKEILFSFTIIPNSLFLNIEGEDWLYYERLSDEPSYYIQLNQSKSLTALIYDGIYAKNVEYNISYTIDGKTYSYIYKDRTSFLLPLLYITEGWNTLEITVLQITNSSNSKKFTYYIYVKTIETNAIEYTSTKSINCSSLYISTPITMTTISSLLNYTTGFSSSNPVSSYVCFGINLCELSDTSVVFAKILYGSNQYLEFYQNKINFQNGSNTLSINFYLETTKYSKYTEITDNSYHHIAVEISYASGDNSADCKVKVWIYIDGVLEGVYSNLIGSINPPTKISFCPGDYKINYCRAFYNVIDFSNSQNNINQIDIVNNYYWWKATYLNNSPDNNLINALNALLYNIESNQLKINSENIGYFTKETLGVDCIIAEMDETFTLSDGSTNNVLDWINGIYDPEDTSELATHELICKVIYNNTEVELDTNLYFKIVLQGTSTKKNKSKNYDLELINETGSNFYAFSPNLNTISEEEDRYSTFLPELKFTLKADVVDSSHTSNVATGNFINKNHGFEADYTWTSSSTYYPYLKKCLTGFPCILIFKIGDNYYFLGIYSFNLGRDSYFNLGYYDPSVIDNAEKISTSDNPFLIFKFNPEPTLSSNLIVAEIQENLPLFDFSLADDSILFTTFDTGDVPMFGDFVYGDSTKDNYLTKIKTFVEKVRNAGGFLFNILGKQFLDLFVLQSDSTYQLKATDYSYKTINTVPDFRTLYKRTAKDTFTQNGTVSINDDSLNDLFGESETYTTKHLNYNALSYYYTTVMTFGLVDSVLKNMNLKSWDSNCFAPYFYDMDTAYGKNNSGAFAVDPYVFSDYYYLNTNDDGSLASSIIYRDCLPLFFELLSDDLKNVVLDAIDSGDSESISNAIKDYYIFNNSTLLYEKATSDDVNVNDLYTASITTSYSGLDIASSYLMAIAKYSDYHKNNTVSSVSNDYYIKSISEKNKNPLEIWSTWRRSDGCCQNADYFMETYYSSYLKDVPEFIFNLNYITKYLYGTDNDKYIKSDIFYGKSLARTRDWLNKRFHILDLYFNVNRLSTNISTKTDNDSVYLNVNNIDTYIKDNDDVEIILSMFKSYDDTHLTNKDFELVFKPYTDFSPLYVELGGTINLYIINDSSEDTTFKSSSSGNLKVNIGGSRMWKSISDTTLDSYLDALNSSTSLLYLNNQYLTSVTATKGTFSSYALTLPNVAALSLKSTNYSGSLSLNKYQKLTTVDISGSKISLNIENCPVLTGVNVSNVVSDSFTINNCENLQTVNLDNTQINNINIKYPGDVNLSNCNNTLFVILNSKGIVGSSFKYTSDSTLTTLIIEGYENIDIEECPYLMSVLIKDINEVKSLTIKNCSTYSTGLKVYSTSDTGYTINLSEAVNLTTVCFEGTKNFTTINFPDKNFTFVSKTFKDCSSLQTISGGSHLYIDGSYVFYNTALTNIPENLTITTTVTDINHCFARQDIIETPVLNIYSVESFLQGISTNNKITDISYLFANLNLSYEVDSSDYTNEKSKLTLGLFINCTNASYVYYRNAILDADRYIFSYKKDGILYTLGLNSVSSSGGTPSGGVSIFRIFDRGVTNALYSSSSTLVNLIRTRRMDTSSYRWYMNVDKDLFKNISSYIKGRLAISEYWESLAIYKIVTFGDTYPKSIENGGSIDISKLFYPNNDKWDLVTSIEYFDFERESDGKTLDLSNMFKAGTFLNVTYLNEFIGRAGPYSITNSSTTTKLSGGAEIYPALLSIKNLPNLHSIDGRTFMIKNRNNPIKITDFFAYNEDTNLFTLNLYYPRDTNGDDALNASSYLSLSLYCEGVSNFNIIATALLTKINSSNESNSSSNHSKESSASKLFSYFNLYISSLEASTKIDFGTSTFLNIKECVDLFSYFKVYDSTNTSTTYDLYISPTLLHVFPNATTYAYAFLGCLLKIDKGLPFNFFGKRLSTYSTSTVYIDKDNDGNYTTEATLTKYEYTTDITSLEGCFMDCKFNDDSCYCSNTEAEYTTYAGNRNTLMVDRTPYDHGTKYTTISLSNPSEDDIKIFYPELDDLKVVSTISESEGYSNYSFNLVTYNNYTYTNPSINCNQYLCLPPDLFYGCSSSCNINSMFKFYISGYWTADSSSLKLIKGKLPPHLFYTFNPASLLDVFTNAIITPLYFGKDDNNYPLYSFVPKNFTKCTNLYRAFKFFIVIPDISDAYKANYLYCILRSDSVPLKVSSYKEAFPSVCFSTNNGSSWVAVFKSLTYYTLMYNIEDKTTGLNIISQKTTTDCTDCTNIVLGYLYTFLYGNIFDSNIYIDDIKYTDTCLDFSKNNGNNTRVSTNIIFPMGLRNDTKCIANKSFILGMSSYPTSLSVLLIYNSNNLTDANKKNLKDAYEKACTYVTVSIDK